MFDPKIPLNDLPLLPGNFDFDKKEFLKLAIKASEEISKLNGLIYLVPNLDIFISPLMIKESVESSAIENINTTTIKVLQSNALNIESIKGPEKEVLHYHRAILNGFERLKKEDGIGYNFLIELQSIIEPDKNGVRKIPGTVIANNLGEILYTPPVGEDNIVRLLTNLEKFINNSSDDIDALIKMPVIHYQFESIHPFHDGNGRTGRILNVLYLVLSKKLDYPILFLSEYINKTKTKYYNLLNKTTSTGDYSEFIIYMLEGVISQAKATGEKIIKIKELMLEIENKLSKLNIDYHKIVTIFFSKPFLTVGEFEKLLGLARATSNRQIKKLEDNDIISSVKIGKNKLLFIKEFIDLLI
ncbi:MAG: Fic family protein [Candidatus Gracilibacteria bacterium]|nr:Fic family protein [Candidatus Gracilibacteria bacterium]MDD2908175.1 Fic family protein [Candidatus Gracilibacteria bacterium]